MNTTRILLTAVIFLVLSLETQAKSSPHLKNATVLLIRHAEKPDEGKDLSPAGRARAQAYVKFFQSLRVDDRAVKLDHLFAAAESKNSDRCHETLIPLSDALQKKIHTEFALSESQKLARTIARSGSGETVLICWHHGAMPDLLKALGARPKDLLPGGEWPEEVFGWLVVLRYDENGKLFTSVSNEGITADDAKHPAPAQ
ncbi:MAG: histidine phosphatase family protein [Verrucomicrobiota bacterium]|nr:histidine phosphatase family protein [Verrucomicrobiota bacterium]